MSPERNPTRAHMNPKPVIWLIAFTLTLAACGDAGPPDAGTPSESHAEAGHDEAHDEERGAATIALTPHQIEAAGLQVIPAGPAIIRESFPLYGVIAPNAERLRQVAARFPGVILTVEKRIGDAVREGEVLARIEANESLEQYALTAPLAGVVIERNANPGEQTGDKSLFTVADLASVWAEISVFPRDLARIQVGQRVRVQSPDTGRSAEGNVVYVAPFGQSANQTITARVLLDNPERRWAPGLYVTAQVTVGETTVPVAIRNEAIQTLEGGTVVFVQGAEGFAPRQVVLGRADGEYSEVVSGLTTGETYAAANSFTLKAELGKGSAEHGH